MRWLLPSMLLASCTSLPDTEAVFEPDGDGFFDTPFPSAARVNSLGGPDWSGFPNPNAHPLLNTYIGLTEERDGAGHNSPFWLRLDGEPKLGRLPSPEASLKEGASVQLIDLTPGDHLGERTPITTWWWDSEGVYVPESLLSVAPVPGWPLRPDSTYALVVTTELVAPPAAFTEAWEGGEGAWGESLRPLWEAAPKVGLNRRRVAMATVVHTTNPLAELEGVARHVLEEMEPAALDAPMELVVNHGSHRVYRTTYDSPLFMAGDKPYGTAGGRFEYDGDEPIVQAWENLDLAVAVSPDAEPGRRGWPVLVWIDGTGSDYLSYAEGGSSPYTVSNWATEAGALALSIDLPLHGNRGTANTNTELHAFNVLQPDSALYIHRQAALDVLYLVRSLTEGGIVFTTPEGERLEVDPNRIVVGGHSQGGITMALALPWLGERVQAAAMSGAGGLLSITAVERSDGLVDFVSLIRTGLGMATDEPLVEHHPFVGLIQSLVDPTDPVNHAPYWFHEDGGLTGGAPASVFVTSGLNDTSTPPRTAEAMAAAGRVPFAGKRRSEAPGMVLRGFDDSGFPQVGNATGWDGGAVTAGLTQFRQGDHWVIYSDEEARDLISTFVATALDGEPTVARK
jgi:acetyl esterase/lipase